ncbi:MAG: peroxiredoxin family protein [Myxococcales bacterium]|nr:peroxiredoxin family protein [Myxococcales bacterium]
MRERTTAGLAGLAGLALVGLALTSVAGCKLTPRSAGAPVLKLKAAPLFELEDEGGAPVSLDAKLPHGPVVLYFYRGFWCRYCVRQLEELAGRYGEFERQDAEVIGISVDSHEISRELKQKLKIPFPLLEDPKARLADQYGVAMHDTELAIPAAFVVGVDGMIHWEFVGERPPDLPTIDSLLAVLAELADERAEAVAADDRGDENFPGLRPFDRR